MNVLTDNPEDALRFFSENHVEVWKKCNPTFTDVTMVEMLLDILVKMRQLLCTQ